MLDDGPELFLVFIDFVEGWRYVIDGGSLVIDYSLRSILIGVTVTKVRE